MSDLSRHFRCSHCKRFGGGPLYVQWSIPDPDVEGRAAEMRWMFCSWECAAHWFQSESERRRSTDASASAEECLKACAGQCMGKDRSEYE